MTTGVVVAVYKEALDWIHQLPLTSHLYLYCKDPSRSIESLRNECGRPEATVTYLRNVGRESHTYLTHVITHYETLDDVILFVQGHPHTDVGRLSAYIEQAQLTQRHSDNFEVCNIHGTYYDWTLHAYDGTLDITTPECRSLGAWFTTYVAPSFPSPVIWAMAAEFAVTRSCIQKRSLTSYQMIMPTLMHVNPVAGHYCERSWFYIFNCDAQE